VIHFFWDRILGTYRSPDAGQTQANGILRIGGLGSGAGAHHRIRSCGNLVISGAFASNIAKVLLRMKF
jgi:hypothetical protein